MTSLFFADLKIFDKKVYLVHLYLCR